MPRVVIRWNFTGCGSSRQRRDLTGGATGSESWNRSRYTMAREPCPDNDHTGSPVATGQHPNPQVAAGAADGTGVEASLAPFIASYEHAAAGMSKACPPLWTEYRSSRDTPSASLGSELGFKCCGHAAASVVWMQRNMALKTGAWSGNPCAAPMKRGRRGGIASAIPYRPRLSSNCLPRLNLSRSISMMAASHTPGARFFSGTRSAPLRK